MTDLTPKSTTEQKLKTTSSRRSFLKKSAIGAPVITTFASKPVFANILSISGNLSNNTSGHYQQAKYDGYSPGYYHAKGTFSPTKNNGHYNTGSQITGYLAASNDKLSQSDYLSLFSTLFNLGPSVPVGIILSPSLWKGFYDNDYALERFTLCAYYNAAIMSDTDFPYHQSDIISFYSKVKSGQVLESDALIILKNLIHYGETDGENHSGVND